MKDVLRHPTAWLPIVMSAAALSILLVYLVFVGNPHETDEGTVAHLFQILMVGQLPIIAYFAITNLLGKTKFAFKVLLIQFIAGVIPFALLYFLER